MRKKNRKQMTLMSTSVEHPRAVELEYISQILDNNPIIYEMVLQDLTRGVKNRNTGAEGMTAEQVVRAAIIKQTEGFSYDDLAFHIVDSRCYRRFCRIGITDKGFQKSALNSNIKAISPETWEAINRILVTYAKDKKVEKGREVRMDCTVVSSNIHDPTDSSLLFDSVRVLTRMLGQIDERFKDLNIPFSDHTKRAKRRMIGIMNTNSKKVRKKRYEDLLKVTHKTVNYAEKALVLLEEFPFQNSALIDTALQIAEDLKQVIELTYRVIDQTTRRIIHDESVHANEKIVSIFEPHTDIIVKDRRETFYGHKVCLSGGSSNLITDCLILDGNPADTTLPNIMLDRQKEIYDRYPLKVALDGGFASTDNLESAKGKGIKDVCFAKKRGIEVEDMCRSDYVYKRLRRFRAGVESGISWLKRCFGFAICTWKTLRSFKSYVWASIVSANLLTLARSV
ncbi:MAG: ISNCY family transposase [Desulfobacteraceae bacterium]|nr:ISNCY family transposase [Desulfobacteraceae bacterium]